MTKAIDILANTRIDKGYTLTEISKITRLPLRYLQAIEEGNLSQLPPEPYCYLMVKDYAQFIGLKGDELVRLYRRDYQNLPQLLLKKHSRNQLTPQLLFRLLTLATFLIFVIYLLVQYLDYNRPPRLEVIWPQTKVSQDTDLIITGSTDPLATVRINQQLVIVSPEGKFEYRLRPKAPSAEVVVTSISVAGNTTTTRKTYQL